MANTASLKKEYAERIAPALKKQFNTFFILLKPSKCQVSPSSKIVTNSSITFAKKRENT